MYLLAKRCSECGVPLGAYEEARYFCKRCRLFLCQEHSDRHHIKVNAQSSKFGRYEQVLGGGFMEVPKIAL